MNRYSIAHKGLSIGNHDFNFKVNDDFFAAFDYSQVQKGDVNVDLKVEKQSNMLILNFNLEGKVTVECDRCLDEFDQKIEFESKLIVRFDESETEGDGDIMWLSSAETEVDLAQYIYESIILSLPYRLVHPDKENGESGCNPEILAKFKIVSEDEFEEITSKENDTKRSPWAKLQQIKDSLESK